MILILILILIFSTNCSESYCACVNFDILVDDVDSYCGVVCPLILGAESRSSMYVP